MDFETALFFRQQGIASGVALDDAPQPQAGDADEARCGQRRRLARCPLEQERQPASRPRPRRRGPPDAVIWTIDARRARRDKAGALEEVQMPPGETGGRAPCAPDGAPGRGTGRRVARPHRGAPRAAASRCPDAAPQASRAPSGQARANTSPASIAAPHAAIQPACEARPRRAIQRQFHPKRRGTRNF